MIHLGMTGSLLLGGAPAKHTHAIFTFDRGTLLYDDSRQFGCIEFSEEFPRRVARLGPEPLEIPFDEFAAELRRHKTRIKSLLLNQTFLRGVGNIYADEALFRAGIHPRALTQRIRRDRARKLYDAIIAVLTEAIAAGGSSISDYVDAEGRKGFFQISHRVYQRTGEPCTDLPDSHSARDRRAAQFALLPALPKGLELAASKELRAICHVGKHLCRCNPKLETCVTVGVRANQDHFAP